MSTTAILQRIPRGNNEVSENIDAQKTPNQMQNKLLSSLPNLDKFSPGVKVMKQQVLHICMPQLKTQQETGLMMPHAFWLEACPFNLLSLKLLSDS